MSTALDVIDRRIHVLARRASTLSERIANAEDLDDLTAATGQLEPLTIQMNVLAEVRADIALAEAADHVS